MCSSAGSPDPCPGWSHPPTPAPSHAGAYCSSQQAHLPRWAQSDRKTTGHVCPESPGRGFSARGHREAPRTCAELPRRPCPRDNRHMILHGDLGRGSLKPPLCRGQQGHLRPGGRRWAAHTCQGVLITSVHLFCPNSVSANDELRNNQGSQQRGDLKKRTLDNAPPPPPRAPA